MEINKENKTTTTTQKNKTKKQKAEREKNKRYVSISLNNRITELNAEGQLDIQGGWFIDDITKKWASFIEINFLNTLD